MPGETFFIPLLAATEWSHTSIRTPFCSFRKVVPACGARAHSHASRMANLWRTPSTRFNDSNSCSKVSPTEVETKHALEAALFGFAARAWKMRWDGLAAAGVSSDIRLAKRGFVWSHSSMTSYDTNWHKQNTNNTHYLRLSQRLNSFKFALHVQKNKLMPLAKSTSSHDLVWLKIPNAFQCRQLVGLRV